MEAICSNYVNTKFEKLDNHVENVKLKLEEKLYLINIIHELRLLKLERLFDPVISP